MNPKFIAIAVVTLDGKIAKSSRHPASWSSKEDKQVLHRLLDGCDAILTGNNTFKTARGPLSKRTTLVFSRSVGGMSATKNRPRYLNPQNTDIKRFVKECGYKRIAVLGGAQTYTYFLKHNLLDEIYLTVEPVVFGKGLNFFESKKFYLRRFRLCSFKKLNLTGSLLLHYKRL